MQNLVIVESPTKARTLQRFLGDKYQIEASMGHVRDLPKSEFGVDIEHNFEPDYIIPRDKRKKANELKKLAAGAQIVWLATDPDREGEAIAWHIAQLLHGADSKKSKSKKVNVVLKRVVFHEITSEAIKDAFAHPGEINISLVNAQQARRILDRLVGYKLSPLLWQKIKRGLSAGRVQSVALRLIVEREREIEAFKPQEYWSIEAELETLSSVANRFFAALIEKDRKKLEIKNKQEADSHLKNLKKASYKIDKVTKKEVRRFPFPPFTTSTLQQAGANRLGFTSKKTMMLAQALYEHGWITYMRTDSVNLSASAVAASRKYIKEVIGTKYLPSTPRAYKTKSKNSQEAHEAIRPTDVRVKSEELKTKGGLTRDHTRLYELIWKRFLACQMSEAVMDQTTIDISADSYTFRVTGSVVKFDGWLRLYGKGEEETEDKEGKQVLPELKEGEALKLIKLDPEQHFTEPPARFNEASLIKKLEELEIGRPSTYAPIISTILERFYVERRERRFSPTALGLAVNDFLISHFSELLDYHFTAKMEDELDEISRGERQWQPTVRQFYEPFEKKLTETSEKAQRVKIAVEVSDKKCPECGRNLIVRFGKFGKFLACSGFPECKHTEPLEEKVSGKCPQDSGDVVIRRTKKGKIFYGCKNWPGCKYASWTKPK